MPFTNRLLVSGHLGAIDHWVTWCTAYPGILPVVLVPCPQAIPGVGFKTGHPPLPPAIARQHHSEGRKSNPQYTPTSVLFGDPPLQGAKEGASRMVGAEHWSK